MLSLVKRGYHKVVSPGGRVKFWQWRGKARRELGDLSYRLKGAERCNACGGKRIVRFKNPAVAQILFNFYKCQDCDFIFVAPTPDLSNNYTQREFPDFGEGEETWNRHYLDSINKYASGKGKLLEIGFGDASFLKLAHEDGWEVYGAELSEFLARRAHEELRLPNIKVGAVEELGYPDNFFDVVAGFNFIEHVPNPRKTLESIRRILRPSGVVELMCPNISGIYHLLMPEILADNDPLKITWVPPDHLSYFNKTNLSTLLESVGFEVIGDESHLMSSLWRQFEVNIGTQVTGEKLEQLISKIQSSPFPRGDARLAEHRREIKSLIVERMTWTMLSDFMALEPSLGAEVGILLLAKKVGG
jgi:ubiquinone/menaquinone biosynthesis C-methylase UbiE